MKTGWVILLTAIGVILLLALIGWAMRKGAQSGGSGVTTQTAGQGSTVYSPPAWNPDTDLGGNGVLL